MHGVRRRSDYGFTLVELLVVVIIIGILAGIAIPIFARQRKAAIDATVKVDIMSAARAAEMYIDDGKPFNGGFEDAVPLLSEYGFRVSGANEIEIRIWNNIDRRYCITGSNLTGTRTGEGKTVRYWMVDGTMGTILTENPDPHGGCTSVAGPKL